MAAGIVETASSRVYAKGTRLYMARAATPSTFGRVAGVKEFDGPNLGREGEVDDTELDPAPDDLGGLTDEQYYIKGKLPGIKDYGNIRVTMNLVRGDYPTLVEIYEKDEIANWEIRFRNGDKFTFSGFIASLPMALQEAQLAQVPMEVTPRGRVRYVSA